MYTTTMDLIELHKIILILTMVWRDPFPSQFYIEYIDR